jgi:hypothetical protein
LETGQLVGFKKPSQPFAMAGKRVATNGTMACPAHFPIIKHCHLFPEIKMFLGTAMISERKAVVTYTGETKTKSSKGPSNAQSEGDY